MSVSAVHFTVYKEVMVFMLELYNVIDAHCRQFK